jgi:hypothetical protein
MTLLGQNLSMRMREDLSEGGLIEEIGEKLLQRCEWTGGRIFNIGGRMDPMVSRAGPLLWVTAFRTCVVPHLGHWAMPLSHTVWAQVCACFSLCACMDGDRHVHELFLCMRLFYMCTPSMVHLYVLLSGTVQRQDYACILYA